MAFGWDDAINAGLQLINKLVPDPAKAAEIAQQFEAQMTARKNAQVALNAEEVKSGSLLGKWRGALGWGCTLAVLYQLIIHDVLIALTLWANPAFPVEKMPKVELQQILKILLGMLGL